MNKEMAELWGQAPEADYIFLLMKFGQWWFSWFVLEFKFNLAFTDTAKIPCGSCAQGAAGMAGMSGSTHVSRTQGMTCSFSVQR